MKALGIFLVVLGLIGLLLGSFTFTRSEEVVDLGDVEVEREERHLVNIPPAASGATLAAGIVLIVLGSMKPKERRS